MIRRHARKLALVMVTLVALGGCVRISGESAIPPEIIEFNDAFLRALPGGTPFDIGAALPKDLHERSAGELRSIHELLKAGPVQEIKHGLYVPGSESTNETHKLASQFESGGRYFFVVINFQTLNGELMISEFRFREIPFDAEARKRLDLKNLNLGNVTGILAGLASLAFIVLCQHDCYRVRPRFWLLWIFCMTICIPAERVIWDTGQWTPSINEIVWLGIGFSQVGRIHPLIIHVGFPTIALFWWLYRGRERLAALVAKSEESRA